MKWRASSAGRIHSVIANHQVIGLVDTAQIFSRCIAVVLPSLPTQKTRIVDQRHSKINLKQVENACYIAQGDVLSSSRAVSVKARDQRLAYFT